MEQGVVGVVTEEWKRGEEEEDRGNNWSWGVQSVGKSSGEGILKNKKIKKKKKRGRREKRKEREKKKKEVKNKVSIHKEM